MPKILGGKLPGKIGLRRHLKKNRILALFLFFHVSADYLLGLEQEETVTLDRLDSEQKAIIYSLLLHFEKENCQRGG